MQITMHRQKKGRGSRRLSGRPIPVHKTWGGLLQGPAGSMPVREAAGRRRLRRGRTAKTRGQTQKLRLKAGALQGRRNGR